MVFGFLLAFAAFPVPVLGVVAFVLGIVCVTRDEPGMGIAIMVLAVVLGLLGVVTNVASF